MKKLISIYGIASLLFAALTLSLAGCGAEATVNRTMWVYNQTGVTLNSLILDVGGKPLAEPVEVLDSPLAAGEIREYSVSFPEKQAKTAEWTIFAVTEDGPEYSNDPWAFGHLDLDGDRPIRGFRVIWDDSHGDYTAGVSAWSFEEMLAELEEPEPVAEGSDELFDAESNISPVDVYWWGTYESDNYTLGITNYNGVGFLFIFLDADGAEAESASAGLDSSNPRRAQFGDIVFEFDGEDTIHVTKYDGDDDVYVTGGDYTGTYTRR